MSRRTWSEARRYVVPAVVVGAALLPWRRRTGLAFLAAGAGVAAFFRDPERPLDPDPDIVYSAADGFVAGVDADIEEPWLPGGSADRIRTFLSIHNVHVQRSPVEAEVTRQEAVLGGFAPALFGAAGENSRRRIGLQGSRGPLVVVQIAGSIARTIACWVNDGDRVSAGQRLGLIHFGSRTDVLLPAGAAEVLVSVGDRVKAGVTPLARYRAR